MIAVGFQLNFMKNISDSSTLLRKNSNSRMITNLEWIYLARISQQRA
jgi:hypothetical protein